MESRFTCTGRAGRIGGRMCCSRRQGSEGWRTSCRRSPRIFAGRADSSTRLSRENGGLRIDAPNWRATKPAQAGGARGRIVRSGRGDRGGRGSPRIACAACSRTIHIRWRPWPGTNWRCTIIKPRTIGCTNRVDQARAMWTDIRVWLRRASPAWRRTERRWYRRATARSKVLKAIAA